MRIRENPKRKKKKVLSLGIGCVIASVVMFVIFIPKTFARADDETRGWIAILGLGVLGLIGLVGLLLIGFSVIWSGNGRVLQLEVNDEHVTLSKCGDHEEDRDVIWRESKSDIRKISASGNYIKLHFGKIKQRVVNVSGFDHDELVEILSHMQPA